jgi:3-hydroxyisobutyrate dehydrogenase-like beta-hydroxyacid dehydrogenase
MSEISVIGLGAMGSALARALVRGGRSITVWNRSAEKASVLIDEGAVLAPNVATAVAASPVVLTCVSDYDVTKILLRNDDVAPGLKGRVLVQLSTGRPQEARDSDEWARQQDIQYLDGAILAFPNQIGTSDATILVSGAESAFQICEPFLRTLADNLSYLGEKVGSASALDFALLSFFFGGILGSLHGVRICEAEGLPVSEYGSLLADISPLLGGDVKHLAESILEGNFENPEARLTTWAAALERIERHAQEAEINSEFPAFASALCRKGIVEGYGMDGVAALIKVLRVGP